MENSKRMTASYLMVATLLVLAVGCGDDKPSTNSGSGGTDSGGAGNAAGNQNSAGSGAGNYLWYRSCGDPVCGPGGSSSNAPACAMEQLGQACEPDSAPCDNGDGCGVLLVCADGDPTMQFGGCPISRARFKRDIRYLSSEERASYATALLDLPLATYRYREVAGDRQHLGFVIDDVEPTLPVVSTGDHVDLYGYLSLAVAAVQEQNSEIEALRSEVSALRAELAASARAAGRPTRSPRGGTDSPTRQ